MDSKSANHITTLAPWSDSKSANHIATLAAWSDSKSASHMLPWFPEQTVKVPTTCCPGSLIEIMYLWLQTKRLLSSYVYSGTLQVKRGLEQSHPVITEVLMASLWSMMWQIRWVTLFSLRIWLRVSITWAVRCEEGVQQRFWWMKYRSALKSCYLSLYSYCNMRLKDFL